MNRKMIARELLGLARELVAAPIKVVEMVGPYKSWLSRNTLAKAGIWSSYPNVEVMKPVDSQVAAERDGKKELDAWLAEDLMGLSRMGSVVGIIHWTDLDEWSAVVSKHASST